MTAIILAICAFALVFYYVAQISWYYMETYRNFSIQEQKDWCARINSTLHACLIVPCMLFAFFHQRWDAEYMPLRSTRISNIFFAISCGYFIFDLSILLRWKMTLWKVFVAHHLIAMFPYLVYLFSNNCDIDLYLLTLFLLVEFAVVPLNITTILEKLSYEGSMLHTCSFYATYTAWFLSRVLLPSYNMYILWDVVLLGRREVNFCILPAAVCGHLISAFCIGVFFFVWTPEVIKKCRKSARGPNAMVHLSESPKVLSASELSSYGTIPEALDKILV
ncbi:unnamed protein product [Albugo candida]|nr:unnamed protein product [Albugo candida]|eukprot:CCI39252.1 unnamed protein product [Albugo candida]